jgi:predicted Zn finger-like uncharacterized protein
VLRFREDRWNHGMIVACSACSARFRVADEKVGPRGARVRCSRCGQTFAVSLPRPPPPPAPPAPPEPPIGSFAPEPTPHHTTSEATGTGGWPSGVLELQGGPGPADPGTPTATSLEGDPFAAFAGPSDLAPPEPTPFGPALLDPPAVKSGFLGSLPVTSLSDLERTGAVPLAGREAPEPDFPMGGLSLEERTPPAMPIRDGAPRWDEPEPTNAVAVGLDGFQEVDLAAGAAPPDPDFDPIEPEPTPPSMSRRPTAPPEPRPVVAQRGTPPPEPLTPDRVPAPATEAPAAVPAAGPGPRPPRAPRVRVLAMNVLSLAVLLVLTAGILVWWRGEGVGAGLRWPGSARRADVETGQVSSGLYEGSRGHPVLFVRGVVRATRAPVEGPVAVRVELVRAGTRVGEATGLAGAVPRPEELAGISTAEELERLRGEIRSRAAPQLEPGQDQPFLVVLPRPDGDVGAIRFRVEPVPAPGR